MYKTANHSGLQAYVMNLQLFSDDPAPAAGGGDPAPSASPAPSGDPAPASDPSAGGGADPSPTPAEEFDVIKYNHEEVRIPVSERQTYLQKGYNYDKVQTQLTAAQEQAKQLERVAKYYGWDNVDEFVSKLNEAEQQRMIEQEAKRLGVDETVIREHLSPLRDKLSTYERELQTLKQQEAMRQVDAEVSQLRAKYPDFEQYQDKVFDMALKNGYRLEDAYRLASYEDRMAAIAKQKEQEVLANVRKRDEKQVLPSNDGPSDVNFSIANASFDDIRKISERVQRGERITL